MNKIFTLFMALSLFGLFSCKAYNDLDVNQFAEALQPYVQLVDVRTPEEFAEGRIPGAVNIDWNGGAFLSQARERLDATRPVYLYCRSGRRSASASKELSKAGFSVFNLLGGYLAWTESGMPVTKYDVETFLTDSGERVDITLVKHGSLALAYRGLTLHVDPVAGLGKPTDYAVEFPNADVLLVTHEHGDHLDDATLATLSREGTRLILNQTSRNQIGRGEVIGNGEVRDLPEGIRLEAVPAYNTTPGREKFHPKGNGNGYVLTIDGLRIYVAGDTEDVPEMADLKDIDVAFLPVNQPYTMTVEQCVAAARIIAPKVLIPYHSSNTDLTPIPDQLPGIDVRLRNMQ